MGSEMKWLFALILIWISLPTMIHADTIVFKDGSKIEVVKAWEERGEIKCIIAGVEIGYPKEEIQRVIRKSWSSAPRARGENILIQQDASCYASGKSFGYCTTLSLYGEECLPREQSTLTPLCKDQVETKRGILDGIAQAYSILTVLPDQQQSPTPQSASACYDLGKQFGKCATLTLYGQICNPKDDFSMPLKCRGLADTRRGMHNGVKVTYRMLGFPVP
jgi:hypothetical protein